MKNRTSLVLMEQLVMVLVFALAASVCLRAFARADRISAEISRQDRAVYLAQNGAETLKACGGDFDEAAQLLGGAVQGNRLIVSYDENWNRTESAGAYRLEIEKNSTQTPGLGQAQVRILGTGDEALFSLELAWQEVD